MDRASILRRPLVAFGREACGDLGVALRREWLVTNGLGGYASGTLAGPNTRRYHGLLVAALNPPVERTVLVGGAIEWAGYNEQRYPLFAYEYAGGTVDREGFKQLQSFTLEGALPVWTYALADALLEKRIWMAYGENTTYVRYRMVRGTRPLSLEITPLITARDFHALTARADHSFQIAAHGRGATVAPSNNVAPFFLLSSAGTFTPGGSWFEHFLHRVEQERGFDDTQSDMYAPGAFGVTLRPGESWTLTLTTNAGADLDGERALAAAQDRQHTLLRQAAAEHADPTVQQLVLAADQFIVARKDEGRWMMDEKTKLDSSIIHHPLSFGRTVIAGYHCSKNH